LVLTVLIRPGAARADLMIRVAPAPAMLAVVEGNTGKFTFTITNSGTVPVTIDSVALGAASFVFLAGDLHDEVFTTMLANTQNCVNVVLPVGGSCAFNEIASTRDQSAQSTDSDNGAWRISNIVTFHQTSDTGKTGSAQGTGTIIVVDPGPPVPEPGGMALAGLSRLGLLVRCCRSVWAGRYAENP
jgi:hypothetical protein